MEIRTTKQPTMKRKQRDRMLTPEEALHYEKLRKQVEGEYDDLLPVCLHQDKLGQWHLLDRHNDEIATFDPAIEKEDMERIMALINRKDK